MKEIKNDMAKAIRVTTNIKNEASELSQTLVFSDLVNIKI